MANNYSLQINVENLNLNDLNKLYAVVHNWEEENDVIGKRADIVVSYKDPIGGTHSEGQGWDPEGNICGECSFITCEECGAYRKKMKSVNQTGGKKSG
jgi:hypothetical protein